jgi:hypothetical protein
MAIESPVQSDAAGPQRLRTWLKRMQPPRAVWLYLALACALLVASEVLWLWHSWPVRELLESERAIPGAPR